MTLLARIHRALKPTPRPADPAPRASVQFSGPSSHGAPGAHSLHEDLVRRRYREGS